MKKIDEDTLNAARLIEAATDLLALPGIFSDAACEQAIEHLRYEAANHPKDAHLYEGAINLLKLAQKEG